MSCGDEVLVPLPQRRAKADDGRRRAAARHAAFYDRLRDQPSRPMADGADFRRRAAQHHMLAHQVPISVPILLRVRQLEKRT